MIPSTSPKKRSLMPSGKLRHTLRGHGHRLSAIVQVGKSGVTDGLVKQLEQALADHELVKLKVAADSPGDRFGVAEQLAALPGVNIVQIVGGAILLYKRHPRVARYEGKRAEPGADESPIETSPKRAKAVRAPRKAKKVRKEVRKQRRQTPKASR
jgi:RNA-binding protein